MATDSTSPGSDGLNEGQRWTTEQVSRQLPSVLALPEPKRSQCLLCLAYEYFIQDMEENAYGLLERADPGYFGEQLKRDMEEIAGMREIVLRIMGKLVETGVVAVKETGD